MKHYLIIIAAVLMVGFGTSVSDISINDAAKDGNIETVKQHMMASKDVELKSMDCCGRVLGHTRAIEIAELLISKMRM